MACTNYNLEMGISKETGVEVNSNVSTTSVADSVTDRPSNTKTVNRFHAFCKWLQTPLGCLITIYLLNVIAWGGMLFLLLCNAAPAMCQPSCNDIDSSRRKWIEIDSQILNALFCIPGFGLAPWRIRDLYLWVQWRIGNKQAAFLRLSDIHCSWFHQRPTDTGLLSPPQTSATAQEFIEGTRPRTMDFVIWCNVWNTIFQACLAGCMWGMNRIDRPSWTTGLFIALACFVSGAGGWITYNEGRKTKRLRALV